MACSSSLSDQEWKLIEPLLCRKETLSATVEQTSDSRWHLLPAENGCNWCDLQRLRLTIAVFWYYKQWRETGVLDEIMDKLHGKVREQAQKNRSGQP